MNHVIFVLICFTAIFQRQDAMESSMTQCRNPISIRNLLYAPVQEYLRYNVKLLRFKHTITPLNIGHFIDKDLKKVFAPSQSTRNVLHNLAKKKFTADLQDIKQLVMRLLCGVNPNKRYRGNSFLNYAIMFNQPQIVAFLLGAGANKNPKMTDKFLYEHDPLCYAIAYHNITCIRLLLLSGAVISEQHVELAQWMSSKFDRTIYCFLSTIQHLQEIFQRPINIFSVDEEQSLSLLKSGYQEIVEDCESKLERLILGSNDSFKYEEEESYQARGNFGGLWQASVSRDDLESSSSSDSSDGEENSKPASRPLKRSVRGLLKESDTNDAEPEEQWQPYMTCRYTGGGMRLRWPPFFG